LWTRGKIFTLTLSELDSGASLEGQDDEGEEKDREEGHHEEESSRKEEEVIERTLKG
jgi:hypothetical protein